MKIIVQKFGGTSVADVERLSNVAKIIQEEMNLGSKVVVVVSAMAGVTNSLIAKCDALSKLDRTSHIREYDAALSSGEVVTASLLALKLQDIGIMARSMQSWQVGLKADDVHGNAQLLEVDSKLIRSMLDSGIIPVITGFQGVNDNGDIATLGKGGSDTSAAIIAANLSADRCDIYTDVDGIYSADPRIVHDAKKIDRMHVDELYALCSAGAKVLHSRAALVAKRYELHMRVLSSFTRNTRTIISPEACKKNEKDIIAVTSNKNLLKIDASHVGANSDKIVGIFNENSIQIEHLCELEEKGFAVIINLSDKNKCQNLLSNLRDQGFLREYELHLNISTVSVVGYGVQSDTNLIHRVTHLLEQNSIKILWFDVSDSRMFVLVHDEDAECAVKLLHDVLMNV
ncbi:aspartate kinase [Rickettsiaceae bacterium]|nr:aspartate kinase [Rickettsiaceae bacterium]